MMLQVNESELPGKIRDLMDKVEKGENVKIMKSGNAIAVLYPLLSKKQGWKRNINKIQLKPGISAQSYLEVERESS